MQKNEMRMRKRPLRMHGSNRIACLICYLAAFAVPVVWEFIALRMLYPWKLVFTAPDVTAHLLNAFPVLGRWLTPIAATTAEGAFSLREILAAREQVWLATLALSAAFSWLMTLLIQLVWRFMHCSPVRCARRITSAIFSYRLTLVVIWLMNAAIAAVIWLFGVQHITGRTLWDYLVCFGIFLLNPLAAAFVSRFAASPAISGKHAFFKRI